MSTIPPLKISIITAVYNGEKYLEATIRSILDQTYQNIEYIIVDGASKDNTMMIINKYRNQIAKIIVEPDNSMYEAINKGIRVATGDYIMVINSDDYLASNDTIQSIVNFIEKNPGCLAYYGNILTLNSNKLLKRKVFKVNKNQLLSTRHCTLIPHPSLIVHRQKSLSSVGYYNLEYKYASDFDYVIRHLDHGAVKYMNIYTTVFRVHPESITSSGKLNKERLHILANYSGYSSRLLNALNYVFIWSLYKIINISINR